MNELKKLYGDMLLLRLFDQQCLDLKKKDLIYSGYHPYEGQEAVAVGFCGALRHTSLKRTSTLALRALSGGRPGVEPLARRSRWRGAEMDTVLAKGASANSSNSLR